MNPIIESLLSLLYPRVCPACGELMVEGERLMCLKCRLSLPLTGFERSPQWNPMMEKLMCRVPVERCSAYFHYRRESPQARLIHRFKYGGQPSLGRELMKEYALALKPLGFFDGIDAVSPVSLSFVRLVLRGYNQSYRLACGVSDVTGLPIVRTLRAAHHRSQTRLGADARARNSGRGVYRALRDNLDGIDHLLLIDDIVTTGSTLRACVEALHLERPEMRISVLALASTRLD